MHGSVLGPLLFLLYTSELISILENKQIGYADDSTLIAVVSSPGVRFTVAKFLSRDLVKVSEWCDLWAMKLNASKTKRMIVSRSRTMHHKPPPLAIGGTLLNESDDLVILGVTFDSKMTFEKHLRSVSRAVSQRLESLLSPGKYSMKGYCFGDALVVLSCLFWNTALGYGAWLPIHTLNYSQWSQFFNWGVFECDLAHRRSVAVLCMLYLHNGGVPDSTMEQF